MIDGAMHSRRDGQRRANSRNLYNLSDEPIPTKKRQSVSQSVSQSVTDHRVYYVKFIMLIFSYVAISVSAFIYLYNSDKTYVFAQT